MYRWHLNIILWYAIHSIHRKRPVCCVLWCNKFTSLWGTFDMTHLPPGDLPCTPNLFHMMLIGFGFLFLPLKCLTRVISYFPQSQYLAHYVDWLSLVCWGLFIKCTNPTTIRSSSHIHPPTIRVVIPHQQTITIVYCCVITAGCNTPDPEVHRLLAWKLQ